MNPISFLLIIPALAIVSGCADDCPGHDDKHPEIAYIDFHDAKAAYNLSFPLDIDKDGNNEFVFNTTLLADGVGDHLHFRIVSRSSNEVVGEDGKVEVLSAGESITQGSSFGYDNETLIVKTSTVTGTTWWGNWKGVQNKYLGVRFRLHELSYYGWIQISANETNELVVIHDMAYARSNSAHGLRTGQKGFSE